jgi:hypothetical protein
LGGEIVEHTTSRLGVGGLELTVHHHVLLDVGPGGGNDGDEQGRRGWLSQGGE